MTNKPTPASQPTRAEAVFKQHENYVRAFQPEQPVPALAAAIRAAERIDAMHKGVVGVFAAIKAEHEANQPSPARSDRHFQELKREAAEAIASNEKLLTELGEVPARSDKDADILRNEIARLEHEIVVAKRGNKMLLDQIDRMVEQAERAPSGESIDTPEFSALAARYGNSKKGSDYLAMVKYANGKLTGAYYRGRQSGLDDSRELVDLARRATEGTTAAPQVFRSEDGREITKVGDEYFSEGAGNGLFRRVAGNAAPTEAGRAFRDKFNAERGHHPTIHWDQLTSAERESWNVEAASNTATVAPGDLPPLPDGDEYSATRMLPNGELAPRYTAASMREYGRACIASNAGAATPRLPTEAMLNAARDWSVKKYGIGIGNDAANGCWQAMWDAAPSINPTVGAAQEKTK